MSEPQKSREKMNLPNESWESVEKDARVFKAGRLPGEREAEDAGDREMVAFLQDVVSGVPWSTFINEVKADDFKKLRLIAMFDLWFTYDEDEILGRLGMPRNEMPRLRRHPALEKIKMALMERAESLSKPRRLQDMVDDDHVQDRTTRELERLAYYCEDPKVKERAINQLTDRMMPPPAREPEGGRLLVIDSRVMEKLIETAHMTGKPELLEDGGFIEVGKKKEAGE